MQNSEHNVPQDESAMLRLDGVRWDDLQMFAAVTRSTSLRDAQRRLGIPINTIRHRLDRLEAHLDTVLILRGRTGISLTPEGHDVRMIADEMALASRHFPRHAGNNAVRHPGELRIGCSAGIGEYWLMPKLAALRQKLPRHRISLICVADDRDVDRDMLDLMISLDRPPASDARVARIATLHLLAYAAPAYLAQHGHPETIDALVDHHYIALSAPGNRADAGRAILGPSLAESATIIRVNTATALYRAVANGLGIGLLPSCVCAIDPQIIALALPIDLRFELYLSYDPVFRNSAPVRAAIDWLHECFDPRVHPWFASHFVPPRAMAASAQTQAPQARPAQRS